MDMEIGEIVRDLPDWETFKLMYIQHQAEQEEAKSSNLVILSLLIIVVPMPTVEDQVRDYALGKALKPNEEQLKGESSTTKKIQQRSLEVNKRLSMMDDVKKA